MSPHAEMPPAASAASESRAETLKVLCIDDDPEISWLLNKRLCPHGIQVIRAFQGIEGYRMAVTEGPKVIITDLRMPDGNGDFLIDCLRGNPKTREIPIIVLTGIREPDLETRMYGLGVARFLVKPISFDVLLEEILRYIERNLADMAG
ncbi:MAG: response regulator [Pirellulales bacterium]